MVPTKKQQPTFSSLEEIRARKDALLEQIQTDSTQVSGLWGKIFVKREETTKGDYIASLIANGMTVIDLILLYRKLRHNYGGLTSLFSGSKKKHKH